MGGDVVNRSVSYSARARRALASAATLAVVLATAPAGAGAPWATAHAAESAPPSQAAVKQALERRPLVTLDGQPVTWKSLAGEVVVVNFWATWCKPCRKELPRLDALDRELSKTGGRVLAVSVDLDRENVRRYAQVNKLKLPICHDGPDGLAKAMSLEMLPYTVVLDRAGHPAYVSTGADDASLDALVKKVRTLASQPRVALTSEVAP